MNKFDRFLKSDEEYWATRDKESCYDMDGDYKNGLREYSEENFGLNKCLEKIFPGYNFIHDKYMKINNEYIYNEYSQKIRPDYICEELKIIVEFDGESWSGGGHYTDPFVIYKDISNTITLQQYGYKVVRIPFYIQLDKDMIKYYFDIDYNGDPLYDMWDDHGFMFPSMKLPSYFCELGLNKFIEELFIFPKNVVEKIMISLGYRTLYYNKISESYGLSNVVPKSIHDLLKCVYGHHFIGFVQCPENIIDRCIYEVIDSPIINEDIDEGIDSCTIDGRTYLTLSPNLYA